MSRKKEPRERLHILFETYRYPQKEAEVRISQWKYYKNQLLAQGIPVNDVTVKNLAMFKRQLPKTQLNAKMFKELNEVYQQIQNLPDTIFGAQISHFLKKLAGLPTDKPAPLVYNWMQSAGLKLKLTDQYNKDCLFLVSGKAIAYRHSKEKN